MKLRRVLLSFFLAGCMILPGHCSFAAASEGLDDGQLGLLRQLGIIDDTYQAETRITRAQLAELGVLTAGMQVEGITAGEAVFYDMTAENPDYGAVAAAARLGLVSGNPNGYFYPDRIATAAEAVKILTCAAGYGPYAEAHGGYPTGYYAAAQVMKLDIAASDEGLSWGEAALLVFQTLHAPAYIQTAFGNTQEYAADRDRTVLVEKHGIDHGEGVVDGVPYTTLTHADETIREGELTIDGEKFLWDTAEEFLGYAVCYYYDSDQSGTPRLRYLYQDNVRNTVLRLQAQDLIAFENDLLTYQREDNAKIQKIRFDEHPDLLYNGVAYAAYADEDVTPQAGDVTLIDYNGDGGYDFIKVRAYTFFMVGAVDAEHEILYEKYDNTQSLMLDDSQCRVTITRGDKEIRMQQLMDGQPLAVARSKNTTGLPRMELVAINQSVSGVVDSIGEMEVGVNYQVYPLGGRLLADYSGGLMVDTDEGKSRLSPGDAAKFYLFQGQAVMAVFTGEQEFQVGYLIDAAKGGQMLSQKQFWMATGKATTETLFGADKVRIDGDSYEDTAELYKVLLQSAALSNYDAQWPVAQPVRYRLDANGRVCELDTIVKTDADAQDDLRLDQSYLSSTLSYLSASKSLYDADWNLVSSLTSNTQVIWVPVDDREYTQLYNFTTAGTMMANRANYNVELFNIGENFAARYAVVYLKVNTSVAVGASPMPVVSVSKALNDQGKEVTKITAYVNGNLTELKVSPDATLPPIQPGDLIRYRTNNAGEIYVLTNEFSPSAPPPERTSRIVSNNVNATGPEYEYDYRTIYGSVWARDAGMITAVDSISTDDGGIAGYSYIDNFLVSGNTYFYVYDASKRADQLTTCTINDLMPYTSAGEEASRILLYTKSGVLNMVYLILE